MARRTHGFEEEDRGRSAAEATEGCGALFGRLDLYLEGEIADPGEAERVREHLARCRTCETYARDYEALTRAILESEASPLGLFPPGGPPLGEGRVARAVERILRSLPEGRGAVSRPRRVGFPKWAAAAAAAFLALGFWLSSGGSRRLDGPDALRGGGIAPPLARAGLRPAEAEETDPADGLLRWVFWDERGGPALKTSSRPFALYGFRVPEARAARPGSVDADAVLEWVVEAWWDGAARRSLRRFFLVPEEPAASRLEVREIFPASWFPAPRSGDLALATFFSGGRAEVQHVRVLVVEGGSIGEEVIPLPVLKTRASWTGVLDGAEVGAPSSPFDLFSGPY